MGENMCTEYAQEPLYLSVARWVMQQQRWVSAREIAQQFDLSTCKAINTVSYILSGVEEITCQTKTVPNQLEGRGCQCQRLIQVTHIDELIATRIRNAINMENEESPSVSEAMARQEAQADAEAVARMAIRVPPDELNREQKWQWMLSKAQRK
ncbi:DNA-binding transcriptional activator CaiF [Edwardsiella tarda]|nr:putative DNA-binding transcriptional activator CaiF [Edwardsiella tarda ATCC 23685]STD28562.1 DNA-binding transcriptional activator CaiF [Edwardsiella tarda]STD41842.1 DNA-binding transcriptional activator CaiF [Edwardsiella tarda]